MSGEVKIRDGRGTRKSVNPGLSWNLRPSVGCAPPIPGPPLDRLWRGLNFDHDPLLQVRDYGRRLADKTSREFVFDLPIPIRTEVIGSLAAQTECAFSPGRVGWVDLGRSEEVEGSLLRNPILVEALKLSLELVLEEDLII